VLQRERGRRYGWPSEAAGKTFAICLDCDIRHAGKLVYFQGLNLSDHAAATSIGVGCNVCEQPACPPLTVQVRASQRALCLGEW